MLLDSIPCVADLLADPSVRETVMLADGVAESAVPLTERERVSESKLFVRLAVCDRGDSDSVVNRVFELVLVPADMDTLLVVPVEVSESDGRDTVRLRVELRDVLETVAVRVIEAAEKVVRLFVSMERVSVAVGVDETDAVEVADVVPVRDGFVTDHVTVGVRSDADF